jgi:ParB family chromosome partitioning protein
MNDLPNYFGLVPIDTIEIGERYRAQPEKDLDKLTASIAELGLLHPVVITPDRKLIAGQRRILACRQLNRTDIEAHIVSDLDEAARLLAEHDENTCRVAFTTGEARALYKKRKELLEPLGEAKRNATLKKGKAAPPKPNPKPAPVSSSEQNGKPELLPETPAEHDEPSAVKYIDLPQPVVKMDTGAAAAKGTGKSRQTLDRAEKIEAVANDEKLPQEVRDFAKAELTAVDKDEKPVNTALAEVQKQVEKAQNYRNQAAVIKGAVSAFERHAFLLEAAFIGADNFDPDCNIDTVRDGFKQIRALVARINKCGKEISNI